METIDHLLLAQQKVIIRVDFNVPLNEAFEVADDTRIQAAIPSIKKVLAEGGSVILMSHLGRPNGVVQNKFSLRHLVKYLSSALSMAVKFAPNCVGSEAQAACASLQLGEVLLLENLRFHVGETKGDRGFAEKLAQLGDIYLNDAFGAAHRAHASTAVIAEFFNVGQKGFGYVMANEIANLDKVLNNPEKKITAIIGGAKVSSKIDVITRLLYKVNTMIIGGGMAYTFAKALGGKVGGSLVEENKLALASHIVQRAEELGVRLLLPVDSVNANRFSNHADLSISAIDEIDEGWMGLDIGEKSRQKFADAIAAAEVILWNGPMGVFEMENFSHGSIAVAQAIAVATKKGAFSLVGGGDSVACIKQFGLEGGVSYISTGGGAMLEYLEGKELPGITAINQ